MTILEALRNFIKTCPCLDEFSRGLGIDYLGENPTSYVIENVPVKPIVKSYVDGSAEKQIAFVFASKDYWGIDVATNLDNIGFYEKFTSWLDLKTRKKELPILEDGKKALSIETTTTPFLFGVDVDSARYQIQCRFIYFEPAPK